MCCPGVISQYLTEAAADSFISVEQGGVNADDETNPTA
jgi:hypothetical protein